MLPVEDGPKYSVLYLSKGVSEKKFKHTRSVFFKPSREDLTNYGWELITILGREDINLSPVVSSLVPDLLRSLHRHRKSTN